jgi:hypothetical protein
MDAGRTKAESPGRGTTSNLLPSRCSVFSTVVAACALQGDTGHDPVVTAAEASTVC